MAESNLLENHDEPYDMWWTMSLVPETGVYVVDYKSS